MIEGADEQKGRLFISRNYVSFFANISGHKIKVRIFLSLQSKTLQTNRCTLKAVHATKDIADVTLDEYEFDEQIPFQDVLQIHETSGRSVLIPSPS